MLARRLYPSWYFIIAATHILKTTANKLPTGGLIAINAAPNCRRLMKMVAEPIQIAQARQKRIIAKAQAAIQFGLIKMLFYWTFSSNQ